MTDSERGSGSTPDPTGSPRGKAVGRRYRQFRKVGYRPVEEGSPERKPRPVPAAASASEKKAPEAQPADSASIAGEKPADSASIAGEKPAAEAPRHLAADEAGSRRGTPEPGTPASQPTQEVRQDQPASVAAAAASEPAGTPAAKAADRPATPTPAAPTAPAATSKAADRPASPTPVPQPAQVATATLPPSSPWQGPSRYPNPSVVMSAPGVPFMPWWKPPTSGAPAQVMLVGLIAGLAGAFLAPPSNGIGWFLAGLCSVGAVLFYAGKPTIERALWLAAALAFLAMGFLRAAEWIFPLCVLASMLCGSIAMAGGRTVRGLIFGAVGLGLAGLRSIPWVAKGFSRRGPIGIRPFLSAGVAGLLLLVFGSLLAGADKGFNDFLEGLVPDLEVGVYVRMGFFGVVAALGALGACYLVAAPPEINEDAEAKPGSLRLKDYGLPVGVLVLLFTGFVGTQLAVLFGGEAYVMKTAGVTFAEYARSGFWQLLWVTILTLGVIAGVARFAVKKTARDQLWLRVLLGSLAVLTLVIVASALSRMWFYQQAYGWTVLRMLVSSCEVWLAVVYVMVIASGISLRANWLPKAVIATGSAFFLAVVVMNPERVVADYNVSRFEATQKIDTVYLSRLSEDAVPALVRLPEPQRSCSLRWLKDRYSEQDWRDFNMARYTARKSLESVAVTEVTCESTYSEER
ncbi:DUF4153 domain-containing protein [Lentzea sp.]|uniref:DUF4153 domain-containing protein n=1 Tax=Lentzea sp. TaxID=56099 RepID=UPI002CEC1290|nr:DUF4153 domain-containing protein [Lentzea sp.]HUQ61383.1 DUF4153 domain-containing protein [Lentzea sp.]